VNDVAALPPELAGPATQMSPSEAVSELIAPEAAQAATTSMSQLVRSIMQTRMAEVSPDGPTLEDLIREQTQLQLKEWLDTHLPPLV